MTLTIVAAMGSIGCGQPCSDPARISGDWVAHSVFRTPTSGTNIEEHPLQDAPILAGTMPWTALFIGSTNEVELEIGPDKHMATYTENPDDCDAFSLRIEGFYEVKELDEGGLISSGTHHEFLYEAKLRYTGPRITGTFRYQDEWVGLIDDQLGSIAVPEAELTVSPVK
jgi:hypothetical protein